MMTAYDFYNEMAEKYKKDCIPIETYDEYLQCLHWGFTTVKKRVVIFDGALEWAVGPGPYVSYFMDMFETKFPSRTKVTTSLPYGTNLKSRYKI